jgi:hypothetical protein
MRKRDNPAVWIKCGQILFVGLLIYWFWKYIFLICAIFGAYFLWRLWNEGDKP